MALAAQNQADFKLFQRPRFLVPGGHSGCSGRTEISQPTLKISIDRAVAVITLNMPEVNNRVNLDMAVELREVCAKLAADDGLRMVILTGAGPVFSSGREVLTDAREIAQLQVAKAVADLPVPVLAALNGDASDHGLELALAADLRLADPGARFSFSVPSAGSFPFDGGTQRLPRLVGPGWARDMLLTGRELSAGEAVSIGLINRAASTPGTVLQSAWQLAENILQGSPLGARYAKEAILSGADMTLAHSLGLEADLNVILQSTRDRTEGISSFLDRREPEFTGE